MNDLEKCLHDTSGTSWSGRRDRCRFKLMLVSLAICKLLSIATIVFTVVFNKAESKRQQLENEPIQQNVANNFGNVNFLKVSAHKMLVCPLGNEDKDVLRLDNTSFNHKREHANEVDLTPTGFGIVHPGMYYIYKSIYFNFDIERPCNSFKTETFHSKLMKKNQNGTHELLTSVFTCCQDCQDVGESGFTAGTFQLSEGDAIEVQVSHNAQRFMRFSNDLTFVGLMMIEEDK